MVLTPVQPGGGKLSAAGALSLHIIPHQPDRISPDQSPSKDPRDLEERPPLLSPEPVIIHSQGPPSPDGGPLAGPPPYQPPEGQGAQVVERLQHSPPPGERSQSPAEGSATAEPQAEGSDTEEPQAEAEATSGVTDPTAARETLLVSLPDPGSGGMTRTLSTPVFRSASPPSASGLPRSGSLPDRGRAEGHGVAQELEHRASTLPVPNGKAAQPGGGGVEPT